MDKYEQNLLFLIDRYFGVQPCTPLYHYTTIETLVNGIIREDSSVCLWATHCEFMNDPTELQDGIAFVSNLLSKLKPEKTKEEYVKLLYKRLSDVFLVSFSQKSNSLPLWNTYGNRGNGIAIEFENLESTSETSLLLRCWYDPDRDTRYLKRMSKKSI